MTDLIGRAPSADERALLEAYDALLALAERTDLAPCVAANVRAALAALAIAVTDLGLRFEHLVDHGA